MKRKLAAILTAAVCAVALLGGCGNDTVNTSSGSVNTSGSNTVSSDQMTGNTKDNSSSSDTIKFSELFKNDVYVYVSNSIYVENDNGVTKSLPIAHVTCFKNDGTFEKKWTQTKNGYYYYAKSLGELAQVSDEEVWACSTEGHTGSYKLGIVTDGTGNNTAYMKAGQVRCQAYLGHATIYNASFIVFREEFGTSSQYLYYLIRDTDETKDKQVVFDEVGTEGILIDASDDELYQFDEDEEAVQSTEFGTESSYSTEAGTEY